MFISLTVSWISGFPSRSMPRSQLTGGTARPTNPCSLVSLSTVRNMLQQPHTLPVSTCRHSRSSRSGKRRTSVTDMVFKLDEEDTHRLHTNTSHPLLLPPVDWCCYGDSGTQLAASMCYQECDWWLVSSRYECVCAHVCQFCSALQVVML